MQDEMPDIPEFLRRPLPEGWEWKPLPRSTTKDYSTTKWAEPGWSKRAAALHERSFYGTPVRLEPGEEIQPEGRVGKRTPDAAIIRVVEERGLGFVDGDSVAAHLNRKLRRRVIRRALRKGWIRLEGQS